MRRSLLAAALVAALLACGHTSDPPAEAPPTRPWIPRIDGAFWNIAGNPDLGPLTAPGQQPVDFAVWKAADGTWQLESCIRNTKEAGNTRLLYRWQGASLDAVAWTPVGIAMRADPSAGETPGGLQAPFVIGPDVAGDGSYHMFYGDWEHICQATSTDGKAFQRELDASGKSGMFGEGPSENTRDPMVLRVGDGFTVYYTSFSPTGGIDYARSSSDLRSWSAPRVVAHGGVAGVGPSSAECPFVVAKDGLYYLFRTQLYGDPSVTRVYRSPDPMDFGVDDDDAHLVAVLPVAAPEIVQDGDQWYIVATKTSLDGIRVARLSWVSP